MSKSVKIAITLSLAAFVAACAAPEEEMHMEDMSMEMETMSEDTMHTKM